MNPEKCAAVRRHLGRAFAAAGIFLSVLRSSEVLADVAPTPPIISGPPTFLVLLVVFYGLLLAAVGLGALAGKLLRRSGRHVSRKRLLVAAAVAALAATVFVEVVSEMEYRRSWSRRRARTEARSYLGAIRSTEVAYFAEWSVWVGGQPLTPLADRRGSDERMPWDPDTRFSILGFAPEGSVACSYALEGPAWSTGGFTARAECDLDRDGEVAVYTITNSGTEIVKSGAPF